MYKIYLQELEIRLIFIILNICICICIYQYYLKVLIFLKVWSIIVLLKYKFILLHILELVYINLFLILYASLLTIYSIFLLQLYFYIIPSFYSYQRKLWVKFCLLCYKSLIYSNILYYSLLIPIINYYLVESNLYQKLSLLINISIELQLYIYIIWFSKLNYFLMNMLIFINIINKIIKQFININTIYKLCKYYKRLLLICILTMLFIILPSINSIQPIIFTSTILICEIVFIYINYKYSLIYKWVL